MADQNDNNLTDLEKHLAAAASRGKKRFQRRQSKLNKSGEKDKEQESKLQSQF